MTDYIAKGQWKTRAGGSTEHKYSSLSEISNWEEDYKFIHIGLNRVLELPILREYFKPLIKKYELASFESKIGKKTFIILSKELKIICKIVLEGKFLCVWWYTAQDKMYRQFLSDLRKQLIKYQFCAFCGGCETKCAFHAITVDAANRRYIINEDICTGCGECVRNEKVGCLLAKSVKTTRGYKEAMING
jgi:ferredoxin